MCVRVCWIPLSEAYLALAAELYTTNAAYMAAAFYEGRANVMQVAKNWVCSFFGNLVGSLICVWLIDEVRAHACLLSASMS